MSAYYWFYYCYEKDEELPTVVSYWKNYPQINYTTASYYVNNVTSFKTHYTSATLPSFAQTSDSNYTNIDDNFTHLVPTLDYLNAEQKSLFNSFVSLRKPAFISFFIDNMIDMPVCFKKSKSLKTKNFELTILKFSNLLMKKGKREQALKILFTALNCFLLSLKKEKKLTTSYTCHWFDMFMYLSNSTRFTNNSCNWRLTPTRELLYNNSGTIFGKDISPNFFLKNYLHSRLAQITPVFSFFVYSVDKNVRKFSRGKSGKYIFVWKYLPPYKRLLITMRWITKDIKLNSSKKITDRLAKTLLQLTTQPQNSYAFHSYIFSHNYAFRNLRKTLMSTLRTTV